MDPLSTLSSATSLIEHSLWAYEALELVSLSGLRQPSVKLRKEYGIIQALLLLFVFPDARDVVERIEKQILKAATVEALGLKQSLSSDCSMLAVASAIIAQVAITAQSLSDLSAAHWTAEAAFIISLITGCLSVFFACLLQQKLSSLYRAEDVKDWLSKPSHRSERRIVDMLISALPDYREGDRETGIALEEVTKLVTTFRDKNRWKAASFNSALMIRAPALLLNYSVGAFLVGLGIYLGHMATKVLNPTAGQSASRAIFIVFIATTAVGLLLHLIPTILKSLELAPVRRWGLLLERKREAAQQDSSVGAPAKLEQPFQGTQTDSVKDEPGSKNQKEEGQADRASWNETLDDTTREQFQSGQPIHEAEPKDKIPHGSDGIGSHGHISIDIFPEQDVPLSTNESQGPDSPAHVQLQSKPLQEPKPSGHSIFADPILAAINASIVAHEQSAATQRVLLKHLQVREERID